MSRALLILDGPRSRSIAHGWIEKAPLHTRVEFKGPRRSMPQNDRMWAMLTDVARQTTHHGLKLTPDDWKVLFLDALKREVRMVPNLDGNGIVSLGRSSSDLSKAEFSDLFEVIEAFAAAKGVTFTEPSTSGADGQPNKRVASGAGERQRVTA